MNWKLKKNVNLYLLIIILITLIIILYYSFNNFIKRNNVEHYCKIPHINRQGGINDKRVTMNYTPQAVVTLSDCNKYWKDWPVEYNSMFSKDEPVVMNMAQLDLPSEKQFGNNKYKYGFIDFPKLAKIVRDKIDFDIYEKSEELLISPVEKTKLKYKYQLDFLTLELNRKTYINRWHEYNPSIKTNFNYDEIKSPIKEINILNNEFKKRCDLKQKDLMTKDELVLFGLIYYDIFKYRILEIRYLNSDEKIPIYIIEISLFRETDLYLNTFSYIGYIQSDNKIMIVNVEFIGINATDTVLLSKGYDKNDIKQEIVNHNFSNSPVMEKNPDAIANQTKKYIESYKLKNQYACFNLNYEPALKNNPYLDYYSRESCEAPQDPYGRLKDYGVFDKPCEKDEECPFYKINSNYKNDYGKCINGTCQLPLNMKNIGYRYYKTERSKLPLCYNCASNKFEVSTLLDTCCEKQFDRKLYPFLKSPDYAFENDFLTRKNYFDSNYCKLNNQTNILECKDIEFQS